MYRHNLHMPQLSRSTANAQPIQRGIVQEQARRFNPRRLGISVLYHDERHYADPPKTPGPYKAIPKTSTTTGIRPYC